jgi:hypothetical protein
MPIDDGMAPALLIRLIASLHRYRVLVIRDARGVSVVNPW